MLKEAAQGERCKECFGFSSDLIPCVYCQAAKKGDREALEDYYEEREDYFDSRTRGCVRRMLDLEAALTKVQETEKEGK